MRVALIGDFDVHLVRDRPPPEEVPHMTPGINLLRGLREIGVRDVHAVILRREITHPMTENGPLGTVHLLPCPRFSGSASFYLWRRHLIHAALKKISPDIVHGQGTEEQHAFAAVTAPYPHVITLHGMMHRIQRIHPSPIFSLSHVARWLETYVLAKARDVICISRAVAEFLQEMHSPARPHLIPNAVAPVFFDVTADSNHSRPTTMLFIGTIYPLKGLHHLVEAVAEARRAGVNLLHLRVIGAIGDATYAAQLPHRATALGVADQIEWLGPRNESGVAHAMCTADLLVLPSHQESAPMCIAEAMAAGLPVIASRVGGIPDMADDGQTGLLVPVGDVPALVQAITTLVTAPQRRAAMGQAGRAKALREYTPRVVAEQTLAVYQEICGKR